MHINAFCVSVVTIMYRMCRQFKQGVTNRQLTQQYYIRSLGIHGMCNLYKEEAERRYYPRFEPFVSIILNRAASLDTQQHLKAVFVVMTSHILFVCGY